MKSNFSLRFSTQWQLYYFGGKNCPQQLPIMKPVKLLDPKIATNLKYEIISARTELGIDPVTQGIEVPVQARVTGRVRWPIGSEWTRRILKMAKREARRRKE